MAQLVLFLVLQHPYPEVVITNECRHAFVGRCVRPSDQFIAEAPRPPFLSAPCRRSSGFTLPGDGIFFQVAFVHRSGILKGHRLQIISHYQVPYREIGCPDCVTGDLSKGISQPRGIKCLFTCFFQNISKDIILPFRGSVLKDQHIGLAYPDRPDVTVPYLSGKLSVNIVSPLIILFGSLRTALMT